jgi:bacteriorhodopsin
MLTIWLILTAAYVVGLLVQSPLYWLALSVAQIAAFIAQAVIVVRMIRELRQRDRGRRP